MKVQPLDPHKRRGEALLEVVQEELDEWYQDSRVFIDVGTVS